MYFRHGEQPPYRTQKAKGLYELYTRPYAVDYTAGVTTNAIYHAGVWPHENYNELPAFARPCPTVPRHGFVDSRPVRSLGDALAVISATLREDPNGEVIFMPIIPAVFSGIMTNGGAVVGPGNDGATAGHGSYNVPAPVNNQKWIDMWSSRSVSTSIKSSPYVEWVNADQTTSELVQLRDGPPSSGADNFIPSPVTVQEVLSVDEQDLLVWERLVESKAGRKGVVCFHPEGSLSSHYAVHCILHNIPVFITKEPVVGETYAAESDAKPEWSSRDILALADMMEAAKSIRCRNSVSEAAACVAVMHANPLWKPNDHLMALMAVGAVFAARYITSACAGEDRHFWGCGPGRDLSLFKLKYNARYECNSLSVRIWKDVKGNIPLLHYGERNYLNAADTGRKSHSYLGSLLATNDRDVVYEAAFDWPWGKLEGRLEALVKDFSGDWRGAYGGEKWANCARNCLSLAQNINLFTRERNAPSLRKVLEAWNLAINTVHNGGKVMTKWINDGNMTSIAKAPQLGFANRTTYDTCSGKIWADRRSELGA